MSCSACPAGGRIEMMIAHRFHRLDDHRFVANPAAQPSVRSCSNASAGSGSCTPASWNSSRASPRVNCRSGGADLGHLAFSRSRCRPSRRSCQVARTNRSSGGPASAAAQAAAALRPSSGILSCLGAAGYRGRAAGQCGHAGGNRVLSWICGGPGLRIGRAPRRPNWLSAVSIHHTATAMSTATSVLAMMTKTSSSTAGI
jgi:hypothetical protein